MSKHAIPPTSPSPTPWLEVLEMVDTQSPEPVPKNTRIALIALIVTIIGMTAAMVAWAAREHDSIKDWTAGRDYATKKEVVDIVEKHYVPTEDFVEVKVEQKHIKEKVDAIDTKVDEMHKLLIRGERPRRDDKTYERRDE